jgi:hypothetical protein
VDQAGGDQGLDGDPAAGVLGEQASRIASLIWSAILSGWPSVTDSDVNRRRATQGSSTRIARRRAVAPVSHHSLGAPGEQGTTASIAGQPSAGHDDVPERVGDVALSPRGTGSAPSAAEDVHLVVGPRRRPRRDRRR